MLHGPRRLWRRSGPLLKTAGSLGQEPHLSRKRLQSRRKRNTVIRVASIWHLAEIENRKWLLTSDGSSFHGLAWSRLVLWGDRHLVLTLWDQTRQIQRGDITTHLHLQTAANLERRRLLFNWCPGQVLVVFSRRETKEYLAFLKLHLELAARPLALSPVGTHPDYVTCWSSSQLKTPRRQLRLSLSALTFAKIESINCGCQRCSNPDVVLIRWKTFFFFPF